MLRAELRETLRLAVPVVLTQLGGVAMNTVDTIFVGRLGPAPLSSVALANSLAVTAVLVGMGTLMGLDPVVAQACGGRRDLACGHALRHGLLLALLLSLPIILLLHQAPWILGHLRQDPSLVGPAAEFARVLNYGTLPFLLFTALRLFMQGVGRPQPAMLVVLGANLLNLLGNWVLVFGHWGAPALGAAGSAWATTLARWSMFAGLAVYVAGRRSLQRYGVHTWRAPLDRRLLSRLLHLGVPVGAQYAMEVGVFAAAAVFMGWFGAVPLAAHQIALNLCSITFMVPLGLSATAAVRVGHALGRDDVAAARRAAAVTYALGILFMTGAALVFLGMPRLLARIYTADGAVGAMTAQLLAVGAAFQIFDASQVIGLGALRGAADTRLPMLVSVVAYWIVALPAGWALAFPAGRGPTGLWWGLMMGLAFVALALAVRFHRRVRPEKLALLKVR